MKNTYKVLGLGAACVACCSLPAIGSLLVGLGLGGLGAASLGWGIGFAILAGAGVALLLITRRRKAAACDTTGSGCGCAGTKSLPLVSSGDRQAASSTIASRF
jgi:hypothetical protein